MSKNKKKKTAVKKAPEIEKVNVETAAAVETNPEKAENIIAEEAEKLKAKAQAAAVEVLKAPKKAEKKVIEKVKAPKAPKPPKPEKETLEPLEFGKELKKRILSANPVFVKFIAAIPLLGAVTTLKNGILISAVLIVTVVLLNLVMYPLNKVIPSRFKYPVEFVAAGIIVTPLLMLAKHFIPTVTDLCQFYLPITALCAIPMVETGYCGKRHGFGRTVLIALLNGVGFAFAALLFAIIREIIGTGALYERPMPYIGDFKFPFIVYPAGAFILLGFIAALWKKMFGLIDKNKGSKI